MTFNQISVAVAVLLRDESCCAAVLMRAFLMWTQAVAALQEAAWPCAPLALRHDRVLWRLSVLLTATWMRLARGALRFECTRLAWMRLARGALRFFERARLAAANAQAAYEKS